MASSRRFRLPLPKPGETFAGYRIEREIARGGAGAVYVALDSKGDRYALKLLLGDMSNPVRLERFRREVNIGTSLLHAGIVRVLDHGDVAGRVFMVMELIEDALPIDRYVEERRIPLRKRVQLLMEAAQTVQTAHTAGIVHRDLKPDNVLVTAGGQVKVVDFGIAKQLDRERLTQSGVIVGTLHYMAPEQIGGQSADVSPRTDVYALGVLAFQIMSGELPIEAGTGIEIMAMALDGKATRLEDVAPDSPRGMPEVVRMAMSVDPSERYADAGAMAKDLAAVCTDTQTEASGRVQAPSRSSRWPLVFGVTVLLAIAVAALTWTERHKTLGLGQLRASAKVLRGEARRLLSDPDRFLAQDAAAIGALCLRADRLETQSATDSDREALALALAPVRAVQAMLVLSQGDRERALALAPTDGEAGQPEVDALWVALALRGDPVAGDWEKNVTAITRALRRGLESPDLYAWLAAALGRMVPLSERRADRILEALARVKAARGGTLSAEESWLWAEAKSAMGEHEAASEVLTAAGGVPPSRAGLGDRVGPGRTARVQQRTPRSARASRRSSRGGRGREAAPAERSSSRSACRVVISVTGRRRSRRIRPAVGELDEARRCPSPGRACE